jgi:hypothetical protein
LDPKLILASYEVGINLVLGSYYFWSIPVWYWYKACIASGDTRLVCFFIAVYISILYTWVGPYISIPHSSKPLQGRKCFDKYFQITEERTNYE